MSKKPFEVRPCRCGTGLYCRRHRAYRLKHYVSVKADEAARSMRVAYEGQQRCGGGRRVLAKTPRD